MSVPVVCATAVLWLQFWRCMTLWEASMALHAAVQSYTMVAGANTVVVWTTLLGVECRTPRLARFNQ